MKNSNVNVRKELLAEATQLLEETISSEIVSFEENCGFIYYLDSDKRGHTLSVVDELMSSDTCTSCGSLFFVEKSVFKFFDMEKISSIDSFEGSPVDQEINYSLVCPECGLSGKPTDELIERFKAMGISFNNI